MNFECDDETKVLTKANGVPMGSKRLVCKDGIWVGPLEDEDGVDHKWERLKASSCRDLSCSATFSEENGYGNKPDDVTIACDNDSCTISCPTGQTPNTNVNHLHGSV